MFRQYSRVNQLRFLFLLPLFLSCQEKSFDPADPADVFARAAAPYHDGLYDIAIQKIGEFKTRFPYSKYSTEGELMVADSHFQLGNFQDAAYSYEQFVRLHPRHKKLDFVLYRIGESYWVEAPEAIDREQDLTRLALTKWETLLKRFPDSKYVKEASTKIEAGRKRIALSEVFAMKFYCRQKIYHSCAYKALIILEQHKQFPDVTKSALKAAALSFEKLALQKRATPSSDKNIYLKSMSLQELQEKAATFKRLAGS